jgi:hypothetical protein
VPTDGNGAAYTADMDSAATPEQTAEVQRLFEVVAAAVLFLVGLGVAQAWINGAARVGEAFGKALGDDLGHYGVPYRWACLSVSMSAAQEQLLCVDRAVVEVTQLAIHFGGFARSTVVSPGHDL